MRASCSLRAKFNSGVLVVHNGQFAAVDGLRLGRLLVKSYFGDCLHYLGNILITERRIQSFVKVTSL